jgi:hypothetical protein
VQLTHDICGMSYVGPGLYSDEPQALGIRIEWPTGHRDWTAFQGMLRMLVGRGWIEQVQIDSKDQWLERYTAQGAVRQSKRRRKK